MNIRECTNWQAVHDFAKCGVALTGWQTPNDAFLMYKGSLELQPGDRCLVVGAYAGCQPILLKMVQPEAEVWVCDPFCNDTHFKNNGVHLVDHYYEQLRFAGLEGQIHTIEEYSQDVGPTWDKPLRWLLIDGSHEEEDAYLDLKYFAPHVVVGGLLYIDDMNFSSQVRLSYKRWMEDENKTTRQWSVEVKHGDENPSIDKCWLLRRTA